MQLVLDTKGLRVSNKNNNFFVESEKSSRIISPGKLSSIAITATIALHTDAIQLAIREKIPILFFGRFGKVTARIWTPYFETISTLRRQQVRFTESVEGTAFMIDVFQLKTDAQLLTLRYLQSMNPRLTSAISKSMKQLKQQTRGFENYRERLPDECQQPMMGTEGAIARIYWATYGNSLPRQFRFQQRSRRPAEDFFNAAINYFYGMLYSVVESGLFTAGLDPYLGILHADAHKKPTLSFDLIEPFRPWVDHLLLRLCFEHKLKATFFTKNQHGLFLNTKGKSELIPAFNDWLRSERKFLERTASVRNHIYYLAGRLAHRIRASEGGN